MSSFLETQPTQFNPYIEQVPVDTYSKIGLTKQAQYEEGLNKVRQYYQNISGLGVDPKYKDYLKGTVDNLQTELKKVTAADFSDAQLVNSVGALANRIGKDPILQAGVYSFNNLQQQQDRINKAKDAGTYSPENEWFLGKQYEAWSNDSDLSNPFKGEYFPYKDVLKKIKDIAKEVGVDENLAQNMFDSNGRPNMYMVETLTKGKDANKIYNALMTGLDQSDFQQLSITGMYKYKDVDAKTLLPILAQGSNQFITLSQNKKLELEEKISNLQNQKIKATKEEASLIDQDIDMLNGQIGQIDSSIKESEDDFLNINTELLNGNDSIGDKIKSKIYTNQFLNQMSYAFSSKETQVKFLDSPLWKSVMEQKKFAADQWYRQQQLDIEKNGLKLRAAELQQKSEENRLKRVELGVESTTGGLASDEGFSYAQAAVDNLNNLVSERDNETYKLGISYLQSLPNNRGKTEEEINKGIEAYIPKDANGNLKMTPREWVAAYGLRKMVDIDKSNDPFFKQKSYNVNLLNKTIDESKATLQMIEDKVATKVGSEGINEANLRKQLTNVTLEIAGKGLFGKKKITLTPDDILNFVKYSSAGIFSSKTKEKEAISSENYLKSKFSPEDLSSLKQYFSEIETASSEGKSWTRWLNPLAPVTEPLKEVNPVIKKARDLYYGNKYAEYNKVREDVFKENFSTYIPLNYKLPMDKNKEGTIDKLNQFLTQRPDKEEIISKLNADGSRVVVQATPAIIGTGAPTYKLVVTDKTGVENVYENINSEVLNLFNIETPKSDPYVGAKTFIRSTPDQSSNKFGLGNKNGIHYKAYESKVTDKDFLGADMRFNNGGYNVYLYKKGSEVEIPVDAYFKTYEEALSFIQNMDNMTFKNILK